MGWSSGSRLFADVAEIIRDVVDNEDDRASIYREMIMAFEARDCDTLDECTGIDHVLDEVLDRHFDDDEDDDYYFDEDDDDED